MIFKNILDEEIARQENGFVELEFKHCSLAISKKHTGISFN